MWFVANVLAVSSRHEGRRTKMLVGCSLSCCTEGNLVDLNGKKGSKSDPDNYRPVFLTCVSCKVMESIIRDYVAEVMMTSGLLSTFQHGFVKGKSCATNLLTAFETWTKWMDDGFGEDIVYLDYRQELIRR